MAGSLAGVRVIDMTNVYSGPIAGAILGDQGADVVKVEAPGGDMQRGPFRVARNGVDGQFAFNNRNKRAISIDLNLDAGREVLCRFIKQADVLMENYRPDVMSRFGFGWETLQAMNPRLIFASINGVGSTGPYAKRRMYDAVIQGISGMATLQDAPDEDKFTMINTLACDKITSMTAAQAICSALYAREQTGRGQRVEVSMLDSALFFLWPDAMVNEHFLSGAVSDSPPDDISVDVPKVSHTSHAGMIKQTKDGFITTMPVQAREWAGVFRALELEEFLGDDGLLTPAGRASNKDLPRLVNEAYRRLTTDEACERLEANQVPYARLNHRNEVVTDPQIKEMGALVEFDHPVGGRMRQPRPPGRFSDTPAEIFRHSPGLGEHTDELLAEVDYSADEIAALRRDSVVS